MRSTALACLPDSWDELVWDWGCSVSTPDAPVWALRPGCLFLDDRGFVDDADVIVQGTQIQQVVPRGELPASIRLIEADGATLIPGFFDSHVHLTFSADAEVVEHLVGDSPQRQVERAVSNARAALLRGVTTLADCGGRTELVLQARDRLDRQHQAAPRLLVSGAPITAVNGHCHWLGGTVRDLQEARDAMEQLLEAGVDFIKLMLTGGNLTAGSDPRVHQFDDEFLDQIALACHQRGVPLVVHVHTEAAVRRAGQVRATIAAHGTCMQPDGTINVSQETLAALSAGGTAVDATITVGARTKFPGATANSLARHGQRRDMLPVFGQMASMGIPVLSGTDAGVPGVEHGAIADAIAALITEVGMTIESAMRSGTSLPARAFGLDRVTGSLDAGLDADLILLDGDPRVDVQALYRPLQVWRAGRLVVSDGRLVGA